MTTYLFEQPWILGVVGTIVTGATVFGWLQTGSPTALKSAAGILLLTILLILVNVWVVTDAEIVRGWIYEVASELENNQVDKVLKRIHPEASERVTNRSRILRHIEFSNMRVTKIHDLKVKTTSTSSRATIRMNVFAEGTLNQGTVGQASGKVPRWISLTLEKLDGVWLIADCEERDPLHEFMNRE